MGWMSRVGMLVVAVASLAVGGVAAPAAGGVLDGVQERGYVRCGVNDFSGYAVIDADGVWRGFQVDFCRALAAAAVGDPEAVEFTRLYTEERFTTVADGDVDVVLSNVTWTLTRERDKGVAFTDVLEYDGQGFVVHNDSPVRRLSDAKGKGLRLCVAADTTSFSNARDYNVAHAMGLEIMAFETIEAGWKAFLDRKCGMLTTDRTALAVQRVNYNARPETLRILPELISREPLTPIVVAGDAEWEAVVRWVRNALIIAEEKGVTRDNADERADAATDSEVQRLLGVEAGMGALLGLDERWALRAIRAVGNYGEIYDRNLGAHSPYATSRGPNALWTEGGLMYAPPLR